MSKTLITGNLGFIGSAFGKSFYSIDSTSIATIQQVTAQRQYFSDVDKIYHLGAVSGIAACEKHREQALNLNVKSTQLYLELAKALKVPILFASSAAVLGEKNLYATTKLMGEQLCDYYNKNHSVDTKILRLSNVYGPGSLDKSSVVAKMFRDAYTRGEINANRNSGKRDFIYVNDVVNSFYDASFEDERYFNVCTGTATTIKTLGFMIAELTGANLNLYNYQTNLIGSTSVTPTLPISYTKLEDGLEKTNAYFKDCFG